MYFKISESEKDALRKLIMLISDLRAKDEERYEAHVDFMNETIKMIRAIENQMNKHWSTVLEELQKLNENISTNLDSLLTGINPKGLRETSHSLKEIMDTMNKSISTMNLENIITELRALQSGGYTMVPVAQSAGKQAAEPISAGTSLTPPGLKAPSGAQAAEAGKSEAHDADWVDPTEKRKDQDDEDGHLLSRLRFALV